MPSSTSRRPPHGRTERPKHPGTRAYRNPAAADTPRDRRSPWSLYPEGGCNLYWRSMLDRVHPLQPARRRRRLMVRLCLFAFCGGLLLLLSSRPADATERREPRLLDPVSTTLKATAREVDSFAGRATGSGTSRSPRPPTRPARSPPRTRGPPPARPVPRPPRPSSRAPRRSPPRSAGPRPQPVVPPRPSGPRPSPPAPPPSRRPAWSSSRLSRGPGRQDRH